MCYPILFAEPTKVYSEERVNRGIALKLFKRKTENKQSIYDSKTERNYGKLLRVSIFLISFVAITPLIILTIINYFQYRKTYEADIIYPLVRQTSNLKNNLESFIQERISVLKYIAQSYKAKELSDSEKLFQIYHSLRNSFGGFVDIGIINEDGTQINYVGPYELLGKNYKSQKWFNNVIFKEVDVSEVFMGFRGFPHFTISVLKSTNADKHLVIRASINIDILTEKIESQEIPSYTDLFIVSQRGLLQTDSKFYGKALDTFPINMSVFSKKSDVVQTVDNHKKSILLSYSFLSNTPFILVEIAYAESLMSNWFKNRNQLILFLIVSIVIIILVVVWGSNRFIQLIRENDLKAARMMHEIEYTNKMASIGRLAAGVSHEINNPLSIINENAGMIQDLLQASEDFPSKGKILQCTNSIFKSVTRCSKITHQLLGFAKRMEPKLEEINLDELIAEVVSFVHREAYLNSIIINVQRLQTEPITLTSDRGLLQQVFINILNNALEATSEGGKVEIAYKSLGNDYVEITISDSGKGIPEKDLPHIFEPFFTTKKEYGTGLGLSITYGIVKKLGGKISVESIENLGTTFTIILPKISNAGGEL